MSTKHSLLVLLTVAVASSLAGCAATPHTYSSSSVSYGSTSLYGGSSAYRYSIFRDRSYFNNPYYYSRINYYPRRYFYPYGRSITVRRNFYYSKW